MPIMLFIKRNLSTCVLLSLTLVLSCISLFVGVIDIKLNSLSEAESLEIMLLSRLPRLMAILCTGTGMSIAGLIMQNLCRNKFVSPSTSSTIASAQLGILLALLFLPTSTLIDRALFSFACAILGTFIFFYFIDKMQFKDIIMIPLVGIMLGNIISGITNFLAFKFDMNQALASWSVGHFSTIVKGNYEIVYLSLPLIIVAYIFARHFNIASMGRNFAKNLGLNYTFILFLGLSIASMITASVVVVVGTISYIGLIVPNIVAIYKGDNLKNTLIDTALAGALFVLCCDLIGRSIIAPYELPIELITGILGSIIFILLILRRANGLKISLRKRVKSFIPTTCKGSA